MVEMPREAAAIGVAIGFDAAPAPAANRAKRALDVILALAALIFFAPVMALAAALIAVDGPGPIIFTQSRTGLHGRRFRIYKFRTMTVVEDGADVRHARPGDRRITRVGRLLRRSSIDELPQLINVLRGDMSLVGPRPHAVAHDEYYAARIASYVHRFRVRPGITGLAQVQGLRGDVPTLECMARRVVADNAYIDQWSFWRDLQILATTAVITPFQRSAA